MTAKTKYTISLNVMLAVAFALIGIVLGATADAPEGGFVGSPVEQVEKAQRWADGDQNVASWDKALAAEFPGYADMATKPADAIPASLVVIALDGKPRTMSLDEAWTRNSDADQSNDVSVIGGQW